MTTTMRLVVTDHAFVNTRHERATAEAAHADFAEHSCTTEDETIASVSGADVAIVNFAPMTRRVIDSMKRGSTIIRYGIGYDNVDLDAAKNAGVRVANVPDYGVETVADHSAAAIVTLARRLPFYDRAIRSDGWVTPAGLGPILSMRQHTVGFLGFGRIAQAVHRRITAFGATSIAYDPFCPAEVCEELGVRQVDLPSLAAQSSILTVHAPLTTETESIVDAEFLAAMPAGSLLVNTARGALIDESALLDALHSGQLSGALLDVTRSEPIAEHSPLRESGRLVLTPHAAFYDEESIDNLQRLASEEAGRALRGEDLRCQVA